MTALESIEFRALQISFEKINYFLEEVLKKQEAAIDENNSRRELPEWMTLEKAVELKGGGAFNTYKTQQRLQPLCGIVEKKVCGRKVWHKDTVLEWLSITDDKLDDYQKKCFASRHEMTRHTVGG